MTGLKTMTRPSLELSGSSLFTNWLAAAGGALAFTTYQAGKVFLIGLQRDGRLSVFERSFERPMGLGAAPGRFWMSSRFQLWRFENFLDAGEEREGFDALYVPTTGHTTGDIDMHDIHVGPDGTPVFVATRFNCLATLSPRGSFAELWRPPFIDDLVAEDRCHLNGLAMDAGRPAFVTCLSRSNVFEGWRARRRDGGVVLDVASGEVAAADLSMPHSPRLHDGSLWVLQAGSGEFGRIDLASGEFEPVCFLPGFARGLSFVGHHAVIGLSRPRENRTFQGLVLNERLEALGASPDCAICVVNLHTGEIEHRLSIEGVVEEIYDVAVLPGVTRPKMLGFRSDEINFTIRPDALTERRLS